MNNNIATFEGSKKLYKDLRSRLSEQAQQNFEAVKNLQELIKQESEKRSENDTVLRSLINTNTSDLRQELNDNIDAVNQKIVNESDQRKLSDEQLQQNISTIQSDFNSKTDEIVDSINQGMSEGQLRDKEILNKLNNFITTSTRDLAAEATKREAADTKLENSIEQETQRATTAEGTLDNRITREVTTLDEGFQKSITDLQTQDNVLLQKIITESNERKAAITATTEQLNSTASTLNKNIKQEAQLREEKDNSLADDIQALSTDVEVTLKDSVSKLQQADTQLLSKIQTETAERKAYDNSLSERLSAEETARNAADTSLNKQVTAINQLVPNSANKDNILADRAFVNSSINSVASFFRGSYASYESLVNKPWQTTDKDAEYYVHNNDYAFVETDETHKNEAWRYVYVESDDASENGWKAQFKVNDTPFTQDQLNAINSTITKADVEKIAANELNITNATTALTQHISNSDNPHNVTKQQLGLGNVDNTSDADKPISNEAKRVMDNISETSLAHIRSKNNPHQVTKQQIGLSDVDNTSDKDKPVSDLQAEAINAVDYNINLHKSDMNNPHGVTKGQLGLSNVDNTSDLNKPLSYAAISALSQKAPVTSPIFTGIPEAPTPADNAGDNQVANVKFVKSQLGASGAVSFKLHQDLTAAQRQVARENIDAMEATHAQSITGFGIVKLTDTLNFPLHNTVYGSYQQTGTPIPDALCDISFAEGKLYAVSKNICGKATGTTIDGVTFTVNDDNSITANGTANEDIDYAISVGYLPHALYDISGCPEGGGLRTYSLQFNLYKGTQFITGVTNEGPLSNSYINTGLYPTYDTYRIVIHIVKGQVLNNLIFYPQLELGNIPTIYSPQGKLNTPLDLPVLKAMHIGETLPEGIYTNAELMEGIYNLGIDTNNYYIADTWQNSEETVSTRSKVKITRIKELVLTGEESFTYNAVTPGKERFQLTVTDAVVDNSQVLVLSNGFNATSFDKLSIHEADNTIAIEHELNYDSISIYSTKFADVDALKSHLRELYTSGNPIIVYYICTTPIKETDTAIAIDSYEDITIVYSDSKVEPYIQAAYSANIWGLLEEQAERVAQIKDAVLYEPQVHTEFQKAQARSNIGLNNVDNTSDLEKPLSNATKAALESKQDKINTTGLLKCSSEGVISSAVAGVDYALPTLTQTDTMLSSGWQGKKYSFEATYPVASYDIAIEIADSANQQQSEAFRNASMAGSATTNIVTALGQVPTIDIPIIVKVVRK